MARKALLLLCVIGVVGCNRDALESFSEETPEIHAPTARFKVRGRIVEMTYSRAGDDYVVEGDIIAQPVEALGAEDLGSTDQSLTAGHPSWFWPGSVIPIVIDPSLPATFQMDVVHAVSHWHSQTSVHFVTRTSQADYVVIRHSASPDICNSNIGRVGGVQYVNLGDNCRSMSTVVHELGHAAGLWHEQSRADRDQYINIYWANIRTDQQFNFRRAADDGFYEWDVTPYDVTSIMHYSSCAFSIYSQCVWNVASGRTILTKSGAGIPYNGVLSGSDIAGIRAMYPPVPPATPSGLSGNAVSPTEVRLYWAPNTETDLQGFQIFRNGAYLGWTGVNNWADKTASPYTTYRYSVRAFNNAGQLSGESASAWITTLVSPSQAWNLWHYYNSRNYDTFFTLTRNDPGYAGYGYYLQPDGWIAKVLPSSMDGAEPLWRYWNPTIGDHFLTIDRNDSGYAYYGYAFEGNEGYIFRTPRWGTVPLYRYWGQGWGDHTYSLTRDDAGFAAYGYQFERIEGYVYPR